MSPGRLTTVLCCCLPTRKLSAKVGPLFPSSAGPETVSLSLVFCRAEAGGDAGGDPTASAACFFTSHGRSTTTTPSLGHERGQQNVHFSTVLIAQRNREMSYASPARGTCALCSVEKVNHLVSQSEAFSESPTSRNTVRSCVTGQVPRVEAT